VSGGLSGGAGGGCLVGVGSGSEAAGKAEGGWTGRLVAVRSGVGGCEGEGTLRVGNARPGCARARCDRAGAGGDPQSPRLVVSSDCASGPSSPQIGR